MKAHLLALGLLAACRSGIAIDTPLAWPCEGDPAGADCPEGWRCGLDSRCHDRAVATDYACTGDGDCEGDWRCGLNGRCHSRDVGAPLECDGDLDCEQGWLCTCCGERVCHPPVGADYPCRQNADCAAGWRCGLAGRCLDPAAGAAYACGSDGDCDPGWRCGLDGRCADLQLEGLHEAYEGPLEAKRVSPLLELDTADLAAGGSMNLYAEWSFSWLRAGNLLHLAHPPARRAELYTLSLDGGPVTGLVSTPAQTFFIDSAGFSEVTWADGGGTLRRIAPAAGATRLKLRDGLPMMVGYGDGVAWFYDARTGVLSEAARLLALDGGNLRVFDAVLRFSAQHYPPHTEELVVATDEGVFRMLVTVADGGLGPLEPLTASDLGNDRCDNLGDAGTLRAVALDATAWALALVHEDPARGVYAGDLQACAQPSNVPPSACALCPADTRLDTFLLSGGANLEALCEPLDGGLSRTWVTYIAQATCVGQDVGAVADRTRTFRSQQASLTRATARGHVSIHTHDTDVWATPVSAKPLRRVDGRLYAGDPFVISGAGQVRLAVHGELAGVGLTLADPPDAATPAELDPGELSTDAVASDGSRWRISTGARDDVLYAAPVDGGALAFRVSPRPFVPLLSLTAVTPMAHADGGTPYLFGYALTSGAVFRFEASDADHWRADELTVPHAEPVSLWSDGPAGRLAAADGRIFALPSGVQLAEPLPGAARAVAFRRVCNQPYALSATGLFRLRRAADAGLAAWQPEPLSSVLPGFDADAGFEGARLDLLGEDLFFTHADGTVVRLAAPLSCP